MVTVRVFVVTELISERLVCVAAQCDRLTCIVGCLLSN